MANCGCRAIGVLYEVGDRYARIAGIKIPGEKRLVECTCNAEQCKSTAEQQAHMWFPLGHQQTSNGVEGRELMATPVELWFHESTNPVMHWTNGTCGEAAEATKTQSHLLVAGKPAHCIEFDD
ncbi:hypothetical protein FGG08_004746 [Glutinoglossum americanum]|uniref:Uncharacterized protein n=1 Tax=Glutinoglossum americanum TaxID=1670608 RepID=A0A9P8HZM2_9PEZI|nr:hypothetical protein FGG08_004746 [Glutinoglossum americanum]